jgi:hypothetical protein
MDFLTSTVRLLRALIELYFETRIH